MEVHSQVVSRIWATRVGMLRWAMAEGLSTSNQKKILPRLADAAVV
jgi:hypothetical protein